MQGVSANQLIISVMFY